MKKSPEYREEELHEVKVKSLKLVNGLLAIGTIHYLVWIVYKIIQWI